MKLLNRHRAKAVAAFAVIFFGLANPTYKVRSQDTSSNYEPPVSSGVRLVREAARRGEELRRRWKVAEAETAFREVAAVDPSNVEAAVGLARVARSRFEYAAAITFLDRSLARHPKSASLLAEYGMLYTAVEDPARARHYFTKALKSDPTFEAAVIGPAAVSLLERDYEAAELRLRDFIGRNPESSRAQVLLGRVLFEKDRTAEAQTAARRALALDEFDTEAIYLLALLRATSRDPEDVRSLARRALSLDPLNAGARRLLSQYVDGQAGYRQNVGDAARGFYERGAALKIEGRMREAVAELEGALRLEPRYYRALIALGDIWLREGDYERAATAAKMALEIDPEGASAHLELSYAYAGIQERARVQVGATDFETIYYREPDPLRYELTAKIFPNYGFLTRRQQTVIDKAVAPLAGYFSRLESGGARHHLLSFDQRVGEVSGLGDVAKGQTFDGRFYASIRGVGGRVTVSGIEYINMASHGGFNTIAHEFAHQVHMLALDSGNVNTIRDLYKQAMRDGRTLDFYAAANEYEYFAQGYEAFISGQKRPSAGVTARHTNKELLQKDPALHKFLTALTARPAARPARVGVVQDYALKSICKIYNDPGSMSERAAHPF